MDLVSTDESLTLLGPDDGPPLAGLPRLARHQVVLADGHEVGVSVCGRGVPIVLASAYDDAASMADVLAGAPNVGKPAQERHLLAALKRAVEK